MRTRIISAIIGIVILGFIVNTGGLIYTLGVCCLNLLALFELYTAFKNINIDINLFVSFFFTFAIYFISYFQNNLLLNFISFCFVMMISMSFTYNIINNKKVDLIGIVFTIFSFTYTTMLFVYFILTRNLVNGVYIVWWIFVITWVCDSAAFFTGTLFGKNKLAPDISPNKTIEGSIGGILLSSLASLVFIKLFLIDISIINAILFGILIGFFCEIGDLSASAIKRYCKVKDFSNIIPGHGGILDRFDSALFSFPIAYYLITLLHL
ncbi:MAG TPA: phosphatidate cytidylyltransferase [Thermoanaerobacterales bacterium]|jgi:phosphatidate cytidylyltransferase|nr:phosphatidate cytidylyltransferase [Thermoanaerobacterales bacterium]